MKQSVAATSTPCKGRSSHGVINKREASGLHTIAGLLRCEFHSPQKITAYCCQYQSKQARSVEYASQKKATAVATLWANAVSTSAPRVCVLTLIVYPSSKSVWQTRIVTHARQPHSSTAAACIMAPTGLATFLASLVCVTGHIISLNETGTMVAPSSALWAKTTPSSSAAVVT
eukprot:scaffold234692_cov32-Tisochrysis_lutea.AAC.1